MTGLREEREIDSLCSLISLSTRTKDLRLFHNHLPMNHLTSNHSSLHYTRRSLEEKLHLLDLSPPPIPPNTQPLTPSLFQPLPEEMCK